MSFRSLESWSPAHITFDPLVLAAFLAGLGVSILAALETLPSEPVVEVQETSSNYSEYYEIVPATQTSEPSYASS